jgi:uncharacterized membrane protein
MRHPLHPAIVHFPVACWSLTVITDFAGLWLGETVFRRGIKDPVSGVIGIQKGL